MHEYGIAESILKATLEKMKEIKIDRIDSIRLRVGKLNMLTPEALQAAFDIVSVKTPLEGVTLDIEETEGSEVAVVELTCESEDNS